MSSFDYGEFARLTALASSALITIGTYDQVWRIWKRRSVADIAPSYILLSGLNEVTWLNYGAAIHEWPMILVGVINFPACVLAIWGYLKFRPVKLSPLSKQNRLPPTSFPLLSPKHQDATTRPEERAPRPPAPPDTTSI